MAEGEIPLCLGGVWQIQVLLVRWAKERVENWCKFNKRKTRNEATVVQASPTKWSLPPQGFVKLNWDASVDKHMNRMGIGVLARDHEGTGFSHVLLEEGLCD
jgi:hypothetical protein